MVFLFIIEHTMLPIFGLVLIGFLLDRKFHIDVKTLSKFMFYLVIPSFIFTNVYETEFPPASVTMIAAMTVFMVFCFFLANLVSRNALMFNNTGNLGVALIILVFSHDPFVVDGQTPYLAEAMVVQIIIFIVQSVSLNTLGLYQAGRGRYAARHVPHAHDLLPRRGPPRPLDRLERRRILLLAHHGNGRQIAAARRHGQHWSAAVPDEDTLV